MYKPRFLKNKKAKKPKGKALSVITPLAEKQITKIAKRQVHLAVQNKSELTLSNQNTITSYAQNNYLFTVSCLPYGNINQGVGAGDRIGNAIKTISCHFNFVLRPAPYNSPTLNPIPIPQDVIIMFGKVKNSAPQTPSNTDFAKLWQSGDTFHAPYGNLLDNLQDVNRDWFTVYKILRLKVGSSINTAFGANNSAMNYSNNDYKLNVIRRINITKYMPKRFMFNDVNSLQPTNDNLWMWAFCNPADGSAASPVPVYMDYTVSYVYENA